MLAPLEKNSEKATEDILGKTKVAQVLLPKAEEKLKHFSSSKEYLDQKDSTQEK